MCKNTLNSMKKILCLLFFIVSVASAKDTKGIRFTEGTWADILNEAKTQQKLIFVDIYTTWCGPCKTMANRVFTDAAVGEKFNASFINFKIDAEKGEGITLAKKYLITAYPSYLFINADGELVHRIEGSMPATRFMAEADKAMQAAKVFTPLTKLEKDYSEGRRDKEFLYELLNRKKLNAEPTTLMLDEYLKAVPESAHKTEKILMIISENIEVIDTKAFDILTASLKRFMNMTPEQQRFVLDGISKAKRNTFKVAVENKDKALFERLIEAVRQTSYSEAGFEAEERKFRLDYAKMTRDAENFRMIATKEGARLLAKNNEELATETQQKTERFIQNAKARGINENTPEYQAALEEMQNNAEKLTAFQLNDYAFGYLQLIENKEQLETALKWSERSIELLKLPGNLDTYANLLAKLGRKKEAITIEKEAIKLAKKQGIDTEELEQSLKLMKQK